MKTRQLLFLHRGVAALVGKTKHMVHFIRLNCANDCVRLYPGVYHVLCSTSDVRVLFRSNPCFGSLQWCHHAGRLRSSQHPEATTSVQRPGFRLDRHHHGQRLTSPPPGRLTPAPTRLIRPSLGPISGRHESVCLLYISECGKRFPFTESVQTTSRVLVSSWSRDR